MKSPQKIINMFLTRVTSVEIKHLKKGLNEARYIISPFPQKLQVCYLFMYYIESYQYPFKY